MLQLLRVEGGTRATSHADDTRSSADPSYANDRTGKKHTAYAHVITGRALLTPFPASHGAYSPCAGSLCSHWTLLSLLPGLPLGLRAHPVLLDGMTPDPDLRDVEVRAVGAFVGFTDCHANRPADRW